MNGAGYQLDGAAVPPNSLVSEQGVIGHGVARFFGSGHIVSKLRGNLCVLILSRLGFIVR